MARRLRIGIIFCLLGLAIVQIIELQSPKNVDVVPPLSAMKISGVITSVRSTSSAYRVISILSDRNEDAPKEVRVITMVRPLEVGVRVEVSCRWKLEQTYWSCFSRDIQRIDSAVHIVWWRRWGWEMRHTIEEIVNRTIPEPEASIVQAMVFGFDDGLTPETKQEFKITGTTHLLVASGMQVVLTIQLFQALLILLGVARRWRLPLVIVAVLVLLLVVGFSPSSIRGAIMGVMPLVSLALGRGRTNAFHSLVVAAGVMVMIDPTVVASLSFQLSFLATAGIIVITPLVEPLLVLLRLPAWMHEGAGATISATIATLPVVIVLSGFPSVLILLPNIVIGAMIQGMTALTIVVVGLGAMSATAGEGIGIFLTILAWIVIEVIHFFAQALTAFSRIPFVSMGLNSVAFIILIALIIRHYGILARRPSQPSVVA